MTTRQPLHGFDFEPAMGGYNFTTHRGECASWVGRGDANDWLALDPWGREARGFSTRQAAAEWCAEQAASLPDDEATPLLDTLASLARTALDDPAGLPAEPATLLARLERRAIDPDDDPAHAYAVAQLDTIINTLNPAELTRETAALTLTVLGQQVAAVCDRMAAEWAQADELDAVADAIGAALDRIDEGINLLANGGES